MDFEILTNMLKMYFCKGNIRWIEKMDPNNRNWKGKGHFIKEVSKFGLFTGSVKRVYTVQPEIDLSQFFNV